MSIEELDTKKALMAFIIEELEAEPLPTSAVAGLQSLAEPGKWNQMVLENGFTNYGAGFAGAAWRSLPGGLIQLRGLITKATEIIEPLVIATLPVKPKEALPFSTSVNSAVAARVDVAANGQVIYEAPAAGALSIITLNGIVFGAGS